MNTTAILYSAVVGAIASGTYLWLANKSQKTPVQSVFANTENEVSVIGNKIRIIDGTALLNEPHRRALLQQIQDRLAFTPQSYEQDVLGLLLKYAEFVQQLPASESHHHAHPGGLLDHTLEVAAIALRISASLEMPLHTATEDRKKLAPVWRYGLLVAAILHDVGKPLTNLIVNMYESPESKDPIRWHPDAGDMLSIPQYQWYNVSFHQVNPDYTAHERLGWSLFNVIVPIHARNWIATTDQRLVEALRQYLTGTDVEPFSKVLKQADSESTANNLRCGSKIRFASAKRQPIRELLMENLREMLDNQAFTIGKDAGGEVFRFDGSKIFILSKVLADKLRKHINAKGNFTIPQDNDRIFGALFECGACLPNPYDKDKYNWNVCVEMKSGTHFFNGLCFEANTLFSPEMILPNEYLGQITCVEATYTQSEARNEAKKPSESIVIEATEQSHSSVNVAIDINRSELKQQTSELAQSQPDSSLKQQTDQPAPSAINSGSSEMEDLDSESSPDVLSDEELVELAMKQISGAGEPPNAQYNSVSTLAGAAMNDEHENEPTDSSAHPSAPSEEYSLPKIASDKIKHAQIASILNTIPNVPAPHVGSEFATAAKSKAKEKSTKPQQNSKQTTSPKIPLPDEMTAEAATTIQLGSQMGQMRPVDLGEKCLVAQKFKNEVDEYAQSGQLSADEKHNLAVKFFCWLQQSLASEKLLMNNPDSLVHVVEDGVVLVTPRIFHKFTEDDRRIDKNTDTPTKSVQQAFEAEKLHYKSRVAGHWKAVVQPIGNKEPGKLNVYWIKADKARALFTNLPPANPRITLEPY